MNPWDIREASNFFSSLFPCNYLLILLWLESIRIVSLLAFLAKSLPITVKWKMVSKANLQRETWAYFRKTNLKGSLPAFLTTPMPSSYSMLSSRSDLSVSNIVTSLLWSSSYEPKTERSRVLPTSSDSMKILQWHVPTLRLRSWILLAGEQLKLELGKLFGPKGALALSEAVSLRELGEMICPKSKNLRFFSLAGFSG